MGSTPQYQGDPGNTALGSLLKLNPNGASPPTYAYVDANDFIKIRIWNATAGQVVNVVMRLLTPNGVISNNEWDLTPDTTRAVNSFLFALTEGFVLSLCCKSATASVGVETFVSVQIVRSGGSVNQYAEILTQGWVNAQQYLTWPGGVLERSTNGSGVIRSITGTTPGAGAEISEVVPSGAMWSGGPSRFAMALPHPRP